MIQKQLQERLHVAMKTQNSFEKDIIRVILSEFSRIGKEIDDVTAVKELKIIRKNLLETNTPDSLKEAKLVEEYLPSQMSQQEIENKVGEIFNEFQFEKSMKNMKPFMSIFNERYPGQDNKIVSQEIKNILS